MPTFTIEYTHNKRRGLLSVSHSTQQGAERGAKATVAAMSGTDKQLHLDTLEKHETVADEARFTNEWLKKHGRPEPSASVLAANAARVFPKPPEPTDE